jgi:RES domain-containing protein
MYESADVISYSSDTLIASVQDGWNVFDEAQYESDNSAQLLGDILNSDWDDDDGEPPVYPFDLVTARQVLGDVDTWEDFCAEVRENPEAALQFSDIFDEDLGRAARTLPTGTLLYRARLGWAGVDSEGRRQPYQGAAIGVPPADQVTAGRANRAGQPVLYCAENELTAVAEKRPARGYWVSTCQLRLPNDCMVLDLVNGIRLNPFKNENLAWFARLADLLGAFAEALSTPLARSDDIEDYLPSQKLCEYVEGLGYAGVRYPSAMEDDGVNVVFFNPNSAEILESRLVEVTSIKIGFHPR